MLEQQKGKLFAAHEYRVDVIDELTRDRDSCRPYYYCNGYREHKKTRMLLMLRRRTRTRAGLPYSLLGVGVSAITWGVEG